VVTVLVNPGYCVVDQERLMGFSTALSAAIHPALGRNSLLELDSLQLTVTVTEPARALVNATYPIRNPTDHAVTEAFLLPISAGLGASSLRNLVCWLYADMPLDLNMSYMRLNITQDHRAVAFAQGQVDASLHNFLLRYPEYNLTAQRFLGKGSFLALAFNLTVPAQSATILSASYFQPYSLYPLYPYPDGGRDWRTNVTSVQGIFSYIGASTALWTETAGLEARVTIDSSLFHSSNLTFSPQNESYVHLLQMESWNPSTKPVLPVAWTVWQGRPDELPSIFVEYFEAIMANRTTALDNPWESHIDEEIEFIGVETKQEGSRILIEARIQGAEDACLIPLLEYTMRSRYGGASGGLPPEKRDGGKYRWTLDTWPEADTLVYQIVVYNNEIWALSPIQFLSLPELGSWNATIPATMWIGGKGGVNDMPLLIFRLPDNVSDPSCEVIYLGRGVPGGSGGGMERADGGIYTHRLGGEEPYEDLIRERLDRGVAFAYVMARDSEGALERSEVFMFTLGDGVRVNLDADYAQPSTGPAPIGECAFGFPLLFGCGLLRRLGGTGVT